MIMPDTELINKKSLKKMRKKQLRASIICLHDEIALLKDEVKNLRDSIHEQDMLISELSSSLIEDMVSYRFGETTDENDKSSSVDAERLFSNSSIKILNVTEE